MHTIRSFAGHCLLIFYFLFYHFNSHHGRPLTNVDMKYSGFENAHTPLYIGRCRYLVRFASRVHNQSIILVACYISINVNNVTHPQFVHVTYTVYLIDLLFFTVSPIAFICPHSTCMCPRQCFPPVTDQASPVNRPL